MAMNKREQAEMEALKQELAEAKALRFTEDVQPDVLPPYSGFGGLDELRRGWRGQYVAIRVDAGPVIKACTSSISNGTGWERASSQHPRELYSTRVLALRALRRDLENACAKELARLDAEIAAELDQSEGA